MQHRKLFQPFESRLLLKLQVPDFGQFSKNAARMFRVTFSLQTDILKTDKCRQDLKV